MEESDRLSPSRLETIKEVLYRVRSVVGQVSLQHRKEEARVQPLLPLLEKTLEEKRLQSSRKAILYTLDKTNEAQNGKALFSSLELGRILSNLIDNAVDAIDRQGEVRLSVNVNENQTTLLISDTGRGIPSSLLHRLGERGFSSGKSEGTGLGLWHARERLSQWGATLEIQSVEGEGTTILLRFPPAAIAKKSQETA